MLVSASGKISDKHILASHYFLHLRATFHMHNQCRLLNRSCRMTSSATVKSHAGLVWRILTKTPRSPWSCCLTAACLHSLSYHLHSQCSNRVSQYPEALSGPPVQHLAETDHCRHWHHCCWCTSTGSDCTTWRAVKMAASLRAQWWWWWYTYIHKSFIKTRKPS